MGRSKRDRKGKQRARADGGHLGALREQEGAERNRDAAISSDAITDSDKARALAGFRSLRGRGGVRISFIAFGRVVQARQPAELQQMIGTTATGAAESCGQKPTH